MNRISDYSILEKLDETDSSIVYRAQKDGQNSTSIIKQLKSEFPSPSEVARFQKEYKIIKNLDLDGIVKIFDILIDKNDIALVLEDFEGISLKEYLNNNEISIEIFLKMAIQLAKTIAGMHENHIVHKDIKPRNIILNPKIGNLKITDFGIASELTHENKEIYNQAVIDGTLAYMSPEQTGRMNRTVDYRTDLYSLGVTFYEMLTGAVPFSSKDPMEIIHSHIARIPPAPAEAGASVPTIVSQIVMKLLSKTPEERYQNSAGLMADLKECLIQFKKKGEIDSFKLAQKDISLTFIIPQMLVGRSRDIFVLMSTFEKASNGSCELLLVAGSPGIGKSAMVNEIHKPVVAKRGYYISGKYEQYRRDVPYSSIIQAFQGLVKQILLESSEKIEVWKLNLLQALQHNGKIITDVLPEVELIIGEQPEVPELGPEETHNRFNFVFQNFIKVFLSREHPIVLFLDDLQWADSASINLIKILVTNKENKFLFLIGAYRDNEVSDSHPLMITLDEIKKKDIDIHEIELSPLAVGHVNEMIVNILKCEEQKSLSLAELIKKKTNGNPFFVNQFLKTLYDEKKIQYDAVAEWQWDIEDISQMQVTDNVVDLLANKISRLDENTIEILKICACIGNRFELEMLSVISGYSIEDVLTYLTVAISEGLISQFGDLYKFHHDRIHEASYSLIEDEDKAAAHYKIGRNVLAKSSKDELSDMIFYIVDQINHGIDLIDEADEKIQLSELNLTAGQKAKKSSAYASATIYLQAGIGLLPEDCWDSYYTLTYTLHMEKMECDYLNLNFDESEKIFHIIVENAKTIVHKTDVYSMIVVLYTSISKYEEALAFGLEGMKTIGKKLPKKVSELRLGIELLKLRIAMGRNRIEDLIDNKQMTNPEIFSYVNHSNQTGTAAYYGDANLFALVVIKGMVNVVKYGNAEHTPFGFNAIGCIVGSGLGLYGTGYRWGEAALKIDERYGTTKYTCRIKFLFAMMILIWKEHAVKSIGYFRDAYKLGLEFGDIIYSGHSINLLGMYRIMLGDNLDEILEEYGKYEDFQKGVRDPFIARNYIENFQMVRCLKGMTDGKSSLNDENFDEEEHFAYYAKDGNMLGIFYFSLVRLRVYYLFGEYAKGRKLMPQMNQAVGKKIALGNLHIPEYYFYYSLCLLASYAEAPLTKKLVYRVRVLLSQMKMKTWAKICPQNFLHKYLIVEAERSRLKGQDKKAARLYSDGIKSANENKYTQNAAIANELAARFYLDNGFDEIAQSYMTEARYAYLMWGATEKVRELEEQYPQLISRIANKSYGDTIGNSTTISSTTTGGSSQALDLSTIMKASRAISGEIVISNLLERLMKIAIENAGAQKGLLMLEVDGELVIEAKGEIDNDKITVLESISINETDELAVSVVNYTARTMKDLVLDDASNDETYSSDPYIIKNKPKSVLCSPLINQGRLSAIFYLENNLITGAFNPERVRVLKMLSSQAAISIDNARLYANLEDKVKERTVELSSTMNKLQAAQRIAEMDMAMASNVQTSFLPKKPPQTSEWDISFAFNPASGVSGDLYDFYEADGELKGLVLLDVSGHGIASGLVTMIARSIFHRNFFKGEKDDLNRVLDVVNSELIVEKGDVDNYLTGILLRFNGNTVEYVNAGHSDLLCKRASSGESEVINLEDRDFKGFFLGFDVFDKPSEVLTFDVSKGDTLLLYTDCLNESKNSEGEEYSENRIFSSLNNAPDSSAQEVLDYLLNDFNSFMKDEPLDDDLTIIIVKRKV